MRNIRTENEIVANWKRDIENPVVSICCITYNHEHCIEDALEGFLIQETDFPYEILIHDDASTDRTADIIREYEAKYPKLIKPIYQTENQFSDIPIISPRFLFPIAKGEYIAMCEGDDYWIAPDKLQMQVNLFDDFTSLVHSDVDNLLVKNKVKSLLLRSVNKSRGRVGIAGDLKKNAWTLPHSVFTCSMLFKREIINEYLNSGVLGVDFNAGDYSLFLFLTQRGHVKYLEKSTAVYRTANGSLMNQKDKSTLIKFPLKNINLMVFYFSYFDVDEEIKKQVLINIHDQVSKAAFLYSHVNKLHLYDLYFTKKKYLTSIFLRLIGWNRVLISIIKLKGVLKELLLYEKI